MVASASVALMTEGIRFSPLSLATSRTSASAALMRLESRARLNRRISWILSQHGSIFFSATSLSRVSSSSGIWWTLTPTFHNA